jgi:NADPH:quinone reductase-like Zn-dependent oxidoreductase
MTNYAGEGMKALRSHAVGGPETLVLDEVADPVPGPGQVLVAVKACSINFPDTLIIRDLYQFKPARPFAPGGELAGVVPQLATASKAGKSGIASSAWSATAALRLTLVDQGRLFALPDDVDFDTGASLLMTYGTNYHGLVDRGHIRPGQTVLVLGAAGGVGLAAVELSKAFGARVVAVSSEEKLRPGCGRGQVVIYGRAPFDKTQSRELADAFKAACGPEGANIVYDIVGGDYSEPALRAIAWEGVFWSSGSLQIAPAAQSDLLKSCDVCGVFWGRFHCGTEKFKGQVDALFDL